MNDGVNITVTAPNITDAQLVAHHVATYLVSTGFNDVTVTQSDPLQFPEPTDQSEALQAIRRLNPGLLDSPIIIDTELTVWADNPAMPDGPDEDMG